MRLFTDGKDNDGIETMPFLHHGEPGAYSNHKTGFTIFCRKCNYGLCRSIETGTVRDHNVIYVDPCPNCLAAEREGREVEMKPFDPKYMNAMD